MAKECNYSIQIDVVVSGPLRVTRAFAVSCFFINEELLSCF